ncbi:30S ribosomal protein S6 [bacterium]|jgi:small subunit ribosomal protein S6|nr:30S ribosomal protein S6 [bacterium]
MQKYETMFILNNNLDEETRKAQIENLLNILKTNGAMITNVDEWGSRELAYEINKETRGYYVVVNYETENNKLNAEFERLCDINVNVIRHIIVALEQ